jgi:hypothetical protein
MTSYALTHPLFLTRARAREAEIASGDGRRALVRSAEISVGGYPSSV